MVNNINYYMTTCRSSPLSSSPPLRPPVWSIHSSQTTLKSPSRQHISSQHSHDRHEKKEDRNIYTWIF